MSKTKKIKLTLLTGFLGSGKTTFLKQMLKHYPGSAVLVNEFGSEGMDGTYLRESTTSEVYELEGGCLCCVLGEDLEKSLLELKNQCFQKNRRLPERIFIEASGAADPVLILKSLHLSSGISDAFEFNSILCIVSGVQYLDKLSESGAAHEFIYGRKLLNYGVESCSFTD
jgi:G3E family GTPase